MDGKQSDEDYLLDILFTIKNDGSTWFSMVFRSNRGLQLLKTPCSRTIDLVHQHQWPLIWFFMGFGLENWPGCELSWTKKLEEICILISAVTENGLNHSLDAILVNYVGTKPNFDHSKKSTNKRPFHYTNKTDPKWSKPNKTD